MSAIQFDYSSYTHKNGDLLKYMFLLYGEADSGPAPGSAEFNQMLEEYGTASVSMRDAGVLLDSNPLQPVSSATTVRVRNGEREITDGPFAEIKEMLGGYFLVECANLDEALRWATTIPSAKYGSVEVRPVMRIGGPPA